MYYYESIFQNGSDLTMVDNQFIQLWENKLNNKYENVLTGKHLMKSYKRKVCTNLIIQEIKKLGRWP